MVHIKTLHGIIRRAAQYFSKSFKIFLVKHGAPRCGSLTSVS